MEHIKLEEIADIFLGLTHTPKYVEKGIPFLSVKDISNGKIDFSKCHYITEKEYDKLPNGAKPQIGDMLFCRVGTIGKPIIIENNIQKFGSFVSLGFLRLKNPNYSIEYIKYWMNSNCFMKQVKMNVKGVAQVNLNTGWLSKFDVPIYKLKLQKEIVNKLNYISDLIAFKTMQIEQLDLLIKSQFVEMFGSVKNSKWNIEKLEKIAEKITDGKHGGCQSENNSGYYFIGATEIYNDKINYENANQITKKDFEKDYTRCDLQIDDLVIVNTGATIGKSAIVIDDRCRNTLLQKSVALIRVKKEKIIPLYLKYCYEEEPSLYNKGQGCARINLLLSQIRNTDIPIPPIELQNKFAEFVKQIDKQKFEEIF